MPSPPPEKRGRGVQLPQGGYEGTGPEGGGAGERISRAEGPELGVNARTAGRIRGHYRRWGSAKVWPPDGASGPRPPERDYEARRAKLEPDADPKAE